MRKITSGSRGLIPLILISGLSASCGGGSDDSTPAPAPSAPDLTTRAAAAQQTADQNAECQQIKPFYFEVGDAAGALTHASVGDNTYVGSTLMNIASATKWLFGAYVTEVRAGVLSAADLQATRMQSGYVSMNHFCFVSQTVESCFTFGANDTLTPASIGRFHYSGGHFQKWGVDNGLANMNGSEVTTEFQRVLGSDVAVSFNAPLLAGGAIMSAEGYAVFLRKILNGRYYISNQLGDQKTCTLPGACATADYSPAPEAWSYSAGHWVEDDPVNGDGAFSSAGAFGFYPWIDGTRTYYGIVAREDLNASEEDGQGRDSAECGRHIRRAFMTGVAE